MSSIIQTVHVVTNLAVGASITIAHNLFVGTGPVAPNIVQPTKGTSIRVTAATSTSVTYRNIGALPASGTFLVQYQHTILRADDPAGTPVSLLYQGDVSADAGAFCNFLSFGADPTGVTNCRDLLQTAVTTCPALLIPVGTYRIEGNPVVIPSGRKIVGANAEDTRLFSEIASDTILRVLDANDVYIADLNLYREVVTAVAYGNGIEVRGNTASVVIERVRVDNGFRCVQVGEETDAQTPARVTLRDVACYHANPTVASSQFGFDIEACDNIVLDHCHAQNHWLEGVKLRVLTTNVRIYGGTYWNNGQSGVGDGIDAYAGGDTFELLGGDWSNNASNGINLKTGPLQPASGYTCNVRVINPRCANNGTNGLGLHRSTPASLVQPLANNICIIGGIYELNGNGVDAGQGIYVRARSVTINSVLCRDNGRTGIMVLPEARDIDIHGPVLLANGTEVPGGYAQLWIYGQRVRVYGGIYNGKNSDNIASDADYAALPQIGGPGIRVGDGADEIYIDHPNIYNPSVARGIIVDMVAGICIINRYGTGDPNNVHQGSIGSIFQRVDGGAGTSLYVRETGTPTQMTNWAAK